MLCVCGELVIYYDPQKGGSLQPQQGGGGAGVAVYPCERPTKARNDHGGGGVVVVCHNRIFLYGFINSVLFRGVCNMGLCFALKLGGGVLLFIGGNNIFVEVLY